MSKTLVLAEKPSVGREIARVLKCGNKRNGFMEGEKYIVTWALGHLVSLAEPGDYDGKYKDWNMQHLPIMPEKMRLKVLKSAGRQFRVVSQLMKRNNVSQLIIATDAGREGELVARWIMRLGGWGSRPFQRLWISSQTDTAIRQGFAQLKNGRDYDALFQAARCRAEADWLIGLNATRALTCKHDLQLTAGRVQTPTLSILVEREKEIAAFQPQSFYKVKATFQNMDAYWQGSHDHRIWQLEKAEAIVRCAQNQQAKIVKIQTKKKSTPPPLAYDLAELQRDANRLFGYTAKQTLSVLQRLYEQHKIVTYPRTDSRYITSDMVNTLPDRLKAIQFGKYKNWVQTLLAKPLQTGKRLVNNERVSDHHAIIPTEEKVHWEKLSNEEKRIFDLIALRFLAVLHPPLQYYAKTIDIRIGQEPFVARGKVLIDAGWRTVLNRNFAADDDDLQTMQELREQVEYPVQKCQLSKHETEPPPHYTEATLLTAMEGAGKFIEDEELRESLKGSGLGTPATRAEIIEKLVNNDYVERRGTQLIPTGKGTELVQIVPDELQQPELTARWEKRLTAIAQKQEQAEAFLKDIRHNTVRLVKEIQENQQEYKPQNASNKKCPICGKPMLFIRKKGQKTYVCSDKRCDFQEENQTGPQLRRVGKKERQRNQFLIRKYCDHNAGGMSLGDLLDDALNDKDSD